MKHREINHIVIGVGTIHRPKLLRENLDSLSKLDCPDGVKISILVVDNSSDSSAKHIVDEMANNQVYPIHYEMEVNRGIVCMRNRVLDEAKKLGANYVAFIDDDERAEKDWILCLHEGLVKYDAQVVQGSTFRDIPDDIPDWLKKNKLLKLRNFPSGTIRSSASTRNVMFDSIFVEKHNLRFNMAFNLMGSSDSFFFTQAHQKGAKIVWIDEAKVIEKLPDSRINFNWIMQRAFRAGHTHFEMKRQLGDPVRMILECLKKAFYIWFMALIALIVYPYSKSLSVKIFRLSVIAVGFFRRALGFNYLEYNKIHGD
ncbi:MAG: succinoglycan biosynthesis protein ExoM [Cyclobacteriaceae bacterium]|jgi:succinoglycan biosynthesis protein ExoM